MKKRLLLLLAFSLLCSIFFLTDFRNAVLRKIMTSQRVEAFFETKIPDRFWLHRCNSPEKLKEFSSKYSGVEVDIIFHDKKMKFETSHDPENLEYYNLENFFNTYKKNKFGNSVWLDFKNLTYENKESAEQCLSVLIKRFNIPKDRLWIESKNWKALVYFRNKGYRTSYYFPYYSKDELTATTQTYTENILSSGNVDAISFDEDYYEFITSLNLPKNIKLLTWLDSKKWYEVLYSSKYQNIINDDRVQVILVKDLGNFHR